MALTLLAVGRTILALGLVLGLLVVLARVSQRWQQRARRVAPRATSGVHLEIVSRRTVGKSSALLVVRVADRTFLVGQSAQQLTLLSELNGDAPSPQNEAGASAGQVATPGMAWGSGGGSPRAWDAFIEHLRELTVRR